MRPRSRPRPRSSALAATRRLAARLAELDGERAPAAADALRREHVLTDDADDAGVLHPVLREAVLAGVAPACARGSTSAPRLRCASAGPRRSAWRSHLLDAPRGALPDAAAILRVAAGRSTGHGRRRERRGAAALRSRRGRRRRCAGRGARAGAARVGRTRGGPRAPARRRRRAPRSARERAERLALAAEATARIDGPAAASAEIRAAIAGWTAGIEERLALDARLGLINSYALGGARGSERAPGGVRRPARRERRGAGAARHARAAAALRAAARHRGARGRAARPRRRRAGAATRASICWRGASPCTRSSAPRRSTRARRRSPRLAPASPPAARRPTSAASG